MPTTLFQNAAQRLTKDQPPRVWSLLISVFGELAQEPSAKISGALLRHITELIGIKPEAMRVALHRLRKDGWIESERIGRRSSYFLTPLGRAQSAQASPRIYASTAAAKQAWLVMHNPGQVRESEDMSAVWISANLCVTSQPSQSAQLLAMPLDAATPVPEWMKCRLCDDMTIQLSLEFATMLEDIRPSLSSATALNRLEVATLRVLLVHSWRRIILKAPILPDHLFPEGWRGGFCREIVAELLSLYPKQALGDLEAAIARG